MIVIVMKGLAIPIVPLVLIGLAIVGATAGTFLILANQKNTIIINIRMVYETNEPYRGIISILNLQGVYNDLVLSDYHNIADSRKDFIVSQINKVLLAPKCFKILKEDKTIIEYTGDCSGKLYSSVIPVFGPGGIVEKLYLKYYR